MKAHRLSFALLVLLIVGIMLLTHALIKNETRTKLNDFKDKGVYLVSLMALYRIGDYEPDHRGALMRTISEHISREGFLYLFVHDQDGKTIFSMALSNAAQRIPPEVQTASLQNMAMTNRQFKIPGMKDAVYEFASPIFEEGKKVGTIRLGLQSPAVTIFSQERISLLAMVTFLVLAALIIGYYGILTALKPLRKISGALEMQNSTSAPTKESSGDLLPVIDGLEQSLQKVRTQLQKIRDDNLSLTSRLGVTTYERNQIIRILDAIPFGIIVTDFHDNVVHINDYILKLLHKKREDVIDRPLFISPASRELTSYLARTIQTTNPAPIETTLPDLAPGELFQIAITYLTNDNREQTGKMISIRNITAAKMAEEAKHEFIAHVAHELRTPVTNIKSYSEMLMHGEVSDREMQREFFNTINEETDRLTNLIQNLLNISKMEMGSLTINKGMVRTDWFVDGCLSAIEASAGDKRLTIERRMPDSFPLIMADKELLRGAIINILGNALKYTPEEGKITFVIGDHSDAVTFEVADTGYGISQEDLPHIFEKFYRSNNPDVTKQTGTGLGLAITSEIVRLHGGEIDVKSQLGEGTHVTIRIPKEEHYLGAQ